MPAANFYVLENLKNLNVRLKCGFSCNTNMKKNRGTLPGTCYIGTRVVFQPFWSLIRVSILAILQVINGVGFLNSSLELGMFLEEATGTFSSLLY